VTSLGAPLAAFLREHLPQQRNVRRHTCDTYAYGFQLLVCFAARRLNIKPSELALEQLDVPLVLSFLDHLETERGNTPRTRNARLAAIKALFRFIEYRVPSCLDQARRIHAIPTKRCDEALVDYLTRDEVQALLDAPDPRSRMGRRDRAMLHLAFAGGLRVSELVGLCLEQLRLQPHPEVHVRGKGRRERVLPLWQETARTLREWLAVRGEVARLELFVNARGDSMTRSGFEYVLAKHVRAATEVAPSLANKRVSPHVLRHTCAMHTLMATRDVRKVALWLGHARLQSTEVYLRADPSEKMEALAATLPPSLTRGQFRPPDKLLAMLNETKHRSRYAQ